MGWLTDKLKGVETVVVPATEVKASRVYYEGEDLHRIETEIRLPSNTKMVLELRPEQARKLATELVLAYRAIGYEFKI